MNGVTIFWGIEVGVIAWRSVKNKSRPPLPSELLATFIVFGGLSLIAMNPKARNLAAVTAGGFVVATMLNFFDPTTGKPFGETPNTATPASVTPQNPTTKG